MTISLRAGILKFSLKPFINVIPTSIGMTSSSRLTFRASKSTMSLHLFCWLAASSMGCTYGTKVRLMTRYPSQSIEFCSAGITEKDSSRFSSKLFYRPTSFRLEFMNVIRHSYLY